MNVNRWSRKLDGHQARRSDSGRHLADAHRPGG